MWHTASFLYKKYTAILKNHFYRKKTQQFFKKNQKNSIGLSKSCWAR